MPPMIGIDLNALENRGEQPAEHGDGSSAATAFCDMTDRKPSNDGADDQQDVAESPSPAIGREGIDIDIVRVGAEIGRGTSWGRSPGASAATCRGVELVAEAPGFTGIVVLHQREALEKQVAHEWNAKQDRKSTAAAMMPTMDSNTMRLRSLHDGASTKVRPIIKAVAATRLTQAPRENARNQAATMINSTKQRQPCRVAASGRMSWMSNSAGGMRYVESTLGSLNKPWARPSGDSMPPRPATLK